MGHQAEVLNFKTIHGRHYEAFSWMLLILFVHLLSGIAHWPFVSAS